MVRGGAWLRWRLGPGPGGGGVLAILCALIMARPRGGGFLAIICSLVMARPIGGNTNLHLPISQMCPSDVKGGGGHFMSKIPQTIDGAVVVSTDERDVSCIIAFQTESILEKFLLRFERLHVDCNDHLYIFDGAHATGSPRAHISCDDSRDKVGPNGLIITRTNFVTLKYETDSWGTENNGFELVITAFKNDNQSGCRESFQCNNYICINQDLVCDGIQHCPHGQDETSANHCADDCSFWDSVSRARSCYNLFVSQRIRLFINETVQEGNKLVAQLGETVNNVANALQNFIDGIEDVFYKNVKYFSNFMKFSK